MVGLVVYKDQKKLRIWTLFMRCLQPETLKTDPSSLACNQLRSDFC